MSRVSLYKHELEVVERLSLSFARIAVSPIDDEHRSAKEDIGLCVDIFSKLLDAFYSRGIINRIGARGNDHWLDSAGFWHAPADIVPLDPECRPRNIES